jgi:hypothetical protein
MSEIILHTWSWTMITFGKVRSQIFLLVFICFKIDKISNLNHNLHLKEFNPCVHVGFTCGTHYFIHQMKKLKMYICVIIIHY